MHFPPRSRRERFTPAVGGSLVATAFVLLAGSWSVAAQANDPADPIDPAEPKPSASAVPLHSEIDRLIAPRLPGGTPAPLADDAEFLRRVSLDLTGTIPTVAETRAFLADGAADKRIRLVDRLLDSPAYARHMQRTFDVLLMRRLAAQKVPAAAWDAFVRESFAKNVPYDEFVRAILAADGTDPKQRGPARFVLDRNGDVHELTRDTARIFLGANLECAQCHDHPEIDDFRQKHYYGLSAFFVRSFVFTDAQTKAAVLAEKAEGEVSFESVFEIRDKKSSGPKSSPPQVFDLAPVEEPKFDKGQEYVVAPAKDVRPVPKFSRRGELPSRLASAGNRRFARTAANRLWHQVFGRGIVHPVDYDHAGNPPSHPELLDLLTDRFVQSGFDVRGLLRELVLSDTYQRTGRSAAGEPTAETESTFATALLKPLTPSQLAFAVLQATGESDVLRTSLGAKFTEADLEKQAASLEGRLVQLFGGEPGKPVEGFEPNADQTLYVSNDPGFQALLKPRSGNLADRILKIDAKDVPAVADEAFLSVLGRRPGPEDVADVRALLEGATDADRPARIRDLIWALVASSEFRFVH